METHFMSDAFERDVPHGVQAGVNVDSLSHEDYLNAPGESVTSTFKTPGEYSYYCEPHQGAGMVGKVVVQ
jgi:plastocyanin